MFLRTKNSFIIALLLFGFSFCCCAQSNKRSIGDDMMLLDSLVQAGKFQQAASSIDRIISSKSLITPELMYQYAQVYAEAGKKEKSLAMLHRAVDHGFWSINLFIENRAFQLAFGASEIDKLLNQIKLKTAPYTTGKAILSRKEKRFVIDLVLNGLKTYYFDLKRASEMSAELSQMFDSGYFEKIDTVSKFTDELVTYLRTKTNDKHFYIGVDYDELTERVPNEEVTTEEERNFGFQEVSVHSGNIGYIRWNECIASLDAYQTAQNALNLLKHTKAIIIDISNNGGGNGEMSTFLYHYLFKSSDKRFENILIKKCKDESEWHRSEPEVVPLPGGPDLGTKPIYVVISGETFSAAEYFAFMMKELNRGTIIGKNTGGGGNPVSIIKNGRFTMYVPTCQIMSSSGKSLEGKGVSPDIELSDGDSLEKILDVVNTDLLKKSK